MSHLFEDFAKESIFATDILPFAKVADSEDYKIEIISYCDIDGVYGDVNGFFNCVYDYLSGSYMIQHADRLSCESTHKLIMAELTKLANVEWKEVSDIAHYLYAIREQFKKSGRTLTGTTIDFGEELKNYTVEIKTYNEGKDYYDKHDTFVTLVQDENGPVRCIKHKLDTKSDMALTTHKRIVEFLKKRSWFFYKRDGLQKWDDIEGMKGALDEYVKCGAYENDNWEDYYDEHEIFVV